MFTRAGMTVGACITDVMNRGDCTAKASCADRNLCHKNAGKDLKRSADCIKVSEQTEAERISSLPAWGAIKQTR